MRFVELKDAPQGLRESARRLFAESFPPHERWGGEAFGRAARDPAFHTKLAVGADGGLLALLYYWTYADMIYVEYLAVAPEMRGRGTGAEIVRRLVAENPGKRILLEIEPPEDAPSRRRLKFYERLGFVANDYEHIHPSYVSGAGAHPHPLVVMTYGGELTPHEFARFRKFLLEIIGKYGD